METHPELSKPSHRPVVGEEEAIHFGRTRKKTRSEVPPSGGGLYTVIGMIRSAKIPGICPGPDPLIGIGVARATTFAGIPTWTVRGLTKVVGIVIPSTRTSE